MKLKINSQNTFFLNIDKEYLKEIENIVKENLKSKHVTTLKQLGQYELLKIFKNHIQKKWIINTMIYEDIYLDDFEMYKYQKFGFTIKFKNDENGGAIKIWYEQEYFHKNLLPVIESKKVPV